MNAWDLANSFLAGVAIGIFCGSVGAMLAYFVDEWRKR